MMDGIIIHSIDRSPLCLPPIIMTKPNKKTTKTHPHYTRLNYTIRRTPRLLTRNHILAYRGWRIVNTNYWYYHTTTAVRNKTQINGHQINRVFLLVCSPSPVTAHKPGAIILNNKPFHDTHFQVL